MDFQTIEIALFAGDEAAVGFTLVKVRAFNAVLDCCVFCSRHFYQHVWL